MRRVYFDDGVFAGARASQHTSRMNLKLEKLLTAGFVAALGASFTAANAVEAQQLTPTPEQVIQDLRNKGIPMEQIKEIMGQAETRRGRGEKTRMESRLKDGAISIEGEGLVCEGRKCQVLPIQGFSLTDPTSAHVTTRKSRICGTINGKLQYC